MATNIRTTITQRTPARADLERAGADALLQRKITLSEYRELVKPNLTEADFEADLKIATKLMVNGLSEPGGNLITNGMAMGSAILEAIGTEVQPAQRSLLERALAKVEASLMR